MVVDVPNGVEGGETLLDGIRGARGLTVGISDAHGDLEGIILRYRQV